MVAHSGLQRPFEASAPFYALLEFENSNDDVEALAMSFI